MTASDHGAVNVLNIYLMYSDVMNLFWEEGEGDKAVNNVGLYFYWMYYIYIM